MIYKQNIWCFFVLFLFTGFSCNSKEYCNKADFSWHEMNKELTDKNKEYTICLINSLEDETITDCEFSERVNAISDNLSFLFCSIDCQDDFWIKLSDIEKVRTKKIIIKGLRLYGESSLFCTGQDIINCAYSNVYAYCISDIIEDIDLQENFRIHLDFLSENCAQ